MGVGVGILGFAHGHVGSYCARWRQQPELEVDVVAGWDHDEARLAAAAEHHGLSACSDAADLLGREDVTGVVIGVETSLHADMVVAAADAGKAVVLQKPMALTEDQADRICAAVEANDVPFTMAWQMRGDPQNQKMKALMDSGVLGKILMFRRRHGLSTHTWPDFSSNWHADPDYNRDIWADDASHPIDLVYWMLGMPQTVTAEIASLVDPKVPNDNGIAVFRYEGGPIAVVSCSFTCIAGENTTEIIGEKGVVVQNYGDGTSANVPRPEEAIGLKWYLKETGEWSYSDIPTPKQHGVRIADLATPISEFLHGTRPPMATAAEGRDVLRLLLACYDSSEDGRRVTL